MRTKSRHSFTPVSGALACSLIGRYLLSPCSWCSNAGCGRSSEPLCSTLRPPEIGQHRASLAAFFSGSSETPPFRPYPAQQRFSTGPAGLAEVSTRRRGSLGIIVGKVDYRDGNLDI